MAKRNISCHTTHTSPEEVWRERPSPGWAGKLLPAKGKLRTRLEEGKKGERPCSSKASN